MANQWLRLWHDMPTDPKWRTIARVSGQRIGDVMAVYLHLLVCASNATERGRTQSFNCEDVASALDIDTEQVSLIVDAMQGRVLDGDAVSGWEKRQVAREDGAAERAKAWREAKKAESNATERNRTQAERKQTPDKDTDTEVDIDSHRDITVTEADKKFHRFMSAFCDEAKLLPGTGPNWVEPILLMLEQGYGDTDARKAVRFNNENHYPVTSPKSIVNTIKGSVKQEKKSTLDTSLEAIRTWRDG